MKEICSNLYSNSDKGTTVTCMNEDDEIKQIIKSIPKRDRDFYLFFGKQL